MLERPWAPSLQRFLPVLATQPSRVALSSMPFPTLRCRGFEDLSHQRFAATVHDWQASPSRQPFTPRGASPRCGRMRSPSSTLFTPSAGRSSLGCFPPSRMTSRPRSTLLRSSSHGLLSSTRAVDSPCGSPSAQMNVRSSEFQRTGRTARVPIRPASQASRASNIPPWGFSPRPPIPHLAAGSGPWQIGRAHV